MTVDDVRGERERGGERPRGGGEGDSLQDMPSPPKAPATSSTLSCRGAVLARLNAAACWLRSRLCARPASARSCRPVVGDVDAADSPLSLSSTDADCDRVELCGSADDDDDEEAFGATEKDADAPWCRGCDARYSSLLKRDVGATAGGGGAGEGAAYGCEGRPAGGAYPDGGGGAPG